MSDPVVDVDPIVQAAVKALAEAGAGSSIHSWRCEYPDRYGPCSCVEEAAAEMVAAVAPLIERRKAEEIADRIKQRREAWEAVR